MPEILSLKQKSQKRNKSRFSQIPIYISITLSQKKVKATPHKKCSIALTLPIKHLHVLQAFAIELSIAR